VSRAIVTCATGPHLELLDIALPSFERFAGLHGYDLIVADPLENDRPPSWWKVAVLSQALAEYGEALWLDADIVITDPSEDLNAPADAWQAIVKHHTGDGEVPNCAVWLCRRPMLPYLDVIWASTKWLHHGWWEQAANLELMGYRPDPRPCRLVTPTELYARTFFLDNGFNVHKWDSPQPDQPRFMHATMHENRADVMRGWAEQAALVAA
jgi:galactosyl transferase GMA12/MNN10 family